MKDEDSIPIYSSWLDNFAKIKDNLKSYDIYLDGLMCDDGCDVYMSPVPRDSPQHSTKRVLMMRVKSNQRKRVWQYWCLSPEVSALATVLVALGYDVYFGAESVLAFQFVGEQKTETTYRSYTEAFAERMESQKSIKSTKKTAFLFNTPTRDMTPPTPKQKYLTNLDVSSLKWTPGNKK